MYKNTHLCASLFAEIQRGGGEGRLELTLVNQPVSANNLEGTKQIEPAGQQELGGNAQHFSQPASSFLIIYLNSGEV